MHYMIIMILIISLLSSFIILLLGKLGIREWVQVHGLKIFSDMFSCDFCLSFWISLGISVIIFIFGDSNLLVFFYSILSTPLIRKLL